MSVSTPPLAALLVLWVLLAPGGAGAHTVLFENGRWFDGETFVTASRAVAEGRFVEDLAGPDEIVDLEGRWIIPPLADAHTHALADTPDPRAEIVRFVRSGILFIKNPNSTSHGVARARSAIAESGLPLRAVFSGSGLTSPGGHPSQIYEAHGAPDGWLAVESGSDLDAVWTRLLAPKPDFVKIYLERSESHTRTRNDAEFRGKRGLDPTLPAEIVRRAKASNLSVVAHVNSAADFRLALEAGVAEINHLPLERLTSEDAARCAEGGVRVVTTVLSHRPAEGVADLSGIHRDNLAALSDAGVALALGTDNGAVDVIDELLAVHALGALAPAEILRAATTEAIRACRPDAGKTCGELVSGEEATFLALSADPLENPEAIRSLESVWVRGHRVTLPEEAPARRSLADELGHVVIRDGVDAALAKYDEWSRKRRDELDFSESQLNDLGYALLRHGRAGDAVRIFRRNVEEFPHSVNAWDSLAEAQAAAGDLAGARESSERVLERLATIHDVSDSFRRQLEETARKRIAGGGE
jgi:hypothetical protein